MEVFKYSIAENFLQRVDKSLKNIVSRNLLYSSYKMFVNAIISELYRNYEDIECKPSTSGMDITMDYGQYILYIKISIFYNENRGNIKIDYCCVCYQTGEIKMDINLK